MTRDHERWDLGRRASAYTELEHPSDLFLEIRGEHPRELLENALFAFYDQIAELDGFEPRLEVTLDARGEGLDDALRALLSEALFRADTEGFVAAGGRVAIDEDDDSPGPWRVSARLWGENADRARHSLLREVKAVTYHRLAVSHSGNGWSATVLLDL
jgi:SHS2 domain-containing protein